MGEVQILVPALDGHRYREGDLIDASVPIVWMVAELLDAEACGRLVRRIDAAGPEAAPISTAHGFVMRPDIRNNTRVMFHDAELAADLFERARSSLPPLICGRRPVGANERIRCYRYEAGQRFAPHYDGAYQPSADVASLLTFMVYLNEGFERGETRFHDFGVDVTPRTGLALFFQHRVLHEGAEVLAGVKYALRSDVMFR